MAGAAILGLSAFAAAAAPPVAGDPTATHPAGAVSGPATAKSRSGAPAGKTGTIEQRITLLHDRLQISPAQQPEWDRFTQVMRDNAHSMDQASQSRRQTMRGMTAAENMQSYALVAMEHAQEMQKLVPVFDALYGTMSGSQKKTADEVFRNDASDADPARHG
jgi:hypothetical protein